MPWWGWVLIVIGILGGLGATAKPRDDRSRKRAARSPEEAGSRKANRGNRARRSGGGGQKAEKTAEELAEAVTTPAQLKALERRLQAAEEAMLSPTSEAAYDRAGEKHGLLQEAVDIASQKTLRWQYAPSIDLKTPVAQLGHAFKVFSATAIVEARAEIGGDERDWYPLKGDDEPEETPEFLKGLRKYRDVVESSLGLEEKARGIATLLRSDQVLANEFFVEESEDETYEDQFLIDFLREIGVPKAELFYKNGFKTPEAIEAADTSVMRRWKGVGPKTAEAFEEWKRKRALKR